MGGIPTADTLMDKEATLRITPAIVKADAELIAPLLSLTTHRSHGLVGCLLHILRTEPVGIRGWVS